jgi:hypothetical protein
MPEFSNLPVGLESGTLSVTGPGTDVASTLDGAGMALGDLVRQVGMAVAETQRRLNENCAETANTLATTMVDVVAVRHTQYNNDGSYRAGGNINSRMPLINYVELVNYEVSDLRLQGQFYASEIKSASTTSTDNTRYASSTSVHLGGWFQQPGVANGVNAAATAAQTGSGTGYASQSHVGTMTGSASSSEYQAGQVRMNAELTPRDDLGVPKPRHVVRGPSLLLLPRGINTFPATVTEQAPLQWRSCVVRVSYLRRPTEGQQVGTGIKDASFVVETSGLEWNFCQEDGTVDETPASTKTNAAGDLFFVVRRTFRPGDDTAPRAFTLTARIGLVNASVAVML